MNTHIRQRGSVAVAVAMILAAAVSSRAQAQESPSADSQAQASSNANPNSQAPALEEVTVTGIRESILKAQDLKRYAPSNIEAITLEDLGKFADSKISDALERVPGVAIEHNSFGLDAIDGVTIRGLGPDYLMTTVNGRDQLGVPGFFGGYGGNPNSGGRDFDYASVPPDILSAVTVYKAPTSNLVESGLAGEVNLQTLRPLDYKGHQTGDFFGTLTASGTYEQPAHHGGPRINGVFGAKLLDGTLGFLVAGVYSNQYSTTNRIQEYQGLHDVTLQNADGTTYVQKNVGTTDGFSPSISYREYDERSISTAVQWKPSDALEVNLDGEYNQFTTIDRFAGGDWYTGYNYFSGATEGGPPIFTPGSYTIRGNQMISVNDSLIIPPAGAPPGDSSAIAYLNALEPNQFWNTGLNAVWHINSRNSLAFDYAHGYGSYLDWWRDPATGLNSNQILHAAFDGSGQYPAVTAIQAPGTNVSDWQNYGQYGIGSFVFQDLTRQKRDQFRLDLTSELSDHYTLKVGARHQQTTYKTVLGYGPYNPNPPALTAALVGPSHQWYGFNVPVPSLNYDAVCAEQTYYCTVSNLGYGSFGGWGLPSNPYGDPADKYAFQGPDSGRLYETNTSFYTQVDGDGDLFGLESSGNVGVRAVRMGEHGLAYEGTTYVLSAGGGPDPVNDKYNTSTPFADQYNYWEILPTANITVKPLHNMNVRLGVAKTMSLPEYPALIPNVSLQINTPLNGVVVPSTLSAGNLHLKPMTAWNYDFTVEYYTERQAAYIGSLFYKRVQNLTTTVTDIDAPIPSQYQSLVPNGPLPSGYTPPRTGFTVALPINANHGETYGAELGTNQPFTFLPSPWDGFGLQANYTYVASTLHIFGDPMTTAFPGSSKQNINATFYYDKYGWDARVAYSYRNDYLSAVAANDQSTYTYAYTTLDASLSKDIGKHLRLNFTVSNITQSPIVNYIGSGRMFGNYFERPRQYTLGITGKF